jgi:predicted ribosome quality control (RQC) complex YloA/Tae2 family protein
MRIKDIFVDYARKHWRNSSITNIDINVKDRVLSLSGYQNKEKYKVAFFWRGRDLFFTHIFHENKKLCIFRNWVGREDLESAKIEELNIFESFNKLGFGEAKSKKSKFENIEDYINKDVTSFTNKKLEKKEVKKKQRLRDNILNDLSKLKAGLELASFVDNPDLESLNVIGKGRFKIKFYGLEGHYPKRDLIFEKVKQWKKSYLNLESRLEKIKEDLLIRPKIEYCLQDQLVRPIWITKKIKENELIKHKNYLQFNYKGYQCYLGRNSSENDYIRNKIAKKTDLWIHLDNFKSGHLFVRGERPKVDELCVLSSALVDLCKIDIKEFQIIYTEASNLKAIKGHRGAVRYKKEKRLLVYFDQDWRSKIELIEEI